MSEIEATTQEFDKQQPLIERATPEDATAIMTIKRAGWLKAYTSPENGITEQDVLANFPDEMLVQGIENWRKGIAGEAADVTKATFVARIDGKVVGYTSPGMNEGKRRLGALYVDPDFQGQGIGAGLLQQAIDWNGPHDLYLRVVAYNEKAKGFYEKFGFEYTGVEVAAEFDEERGIKLLPEVEMVLRV